METFLDILKVWWWFFLPLILWFPFKTLYLWWIRWENWYKRVKWILLEVKPPKEILKPFSAMENLFSIFWEIQDHGIWRERWCEGMLIQGPNWFSWEIVSIGGEIHFYLRIPERSRDELEAAIYSQYPDAEISLVEDYTKSVAQDVPNKEWELYGEDYSLIREDYYPIKTYSMFFEREAEEKRVLEEKRLDPLDELLEAMAKLGPNERFWFQIVCAPVMSGDFFNYAEKGKEFINKMVQRQAPPKPKSIIQTESEKLLPGAPLEEKAGKLELVAPELRLTAGEREVLSGVENKIKKLGFKTILRVIYLYKRDEPHSYMNHRLARNYIRQFSTQHLNTFWWYGPTRTRIHYWFRKRRLYLRKRKMFRNFVDRLPSLFPRTFMGDPLFPFGHPQGRRPGIRATILLNAEELATIFHLPSKVITPAIAPVEAKKAGPPPTLPVE